MIVALVVSRVVENSSRERITWVIRKISVHDGDNVIGIKLVIDQNTIHVSHIGLVSVVAVS